MKRVLSGWLQEKKVTTTKSKHKRVYPRVAEEYELIEECGSGASGSVWRARCRGSKTEIAVKQINLETVGAEVDTFVSEAQTMSSLHHPNLLPLYCSFMHKESLWMVMPFVSGGSVQDVMKYRSPGGFEEQCICTIMYETLKGLVYLNNHGIIHRDIKSGNILIGQDGTTWLADFGIAAKTNRNGSWGSKGGQRHTFAGTICWMAPEIMQGDDYDEKADIWSLGMTMLELAHGSPPFANMSTMKILVTVLNEDPPRLEDSTGSRVWSKHFKDVVARCLVKESELRPSAEQLLSHRFFKGARSKEYIREQLVADVPDMLTRHQEMKEKVQLGLVEAGVEANQKTTCNFDLTGLRHNLPPEQQAPCAGSGGGDLSTAASAQGLAPTSSAASAESLQQGVGSGGGGANGGAGSIARSLSQQSSLSRHSPPENPSSTSPSGLAANAAAAAASSSGESPDWDWGDQAPRPPQQQLALAAARSMPALGSVGNSSGSSRAGLLPSSAAAQERGPRQQLRVPESSSCPYMPRAGGGGVKIGGCIISPTVGGGSGNPQQQQPGGGIGGPGQLSKSQSCNYQRKGRFVVYEEGAGGGSSAPCSPAHGLAPAPSLANNMANSGGGGGGLFRRARALSGGGGSAGVPEGDYRDKLVKESQRLQRQQTSTAGDPRMQKQYSSPGSGEYATAKQRGTIMVGGAALTSMPSRREGGLNGDPGRPGQPPVNIVVGQQQQRR